MEAKTPCASKCSGLIFEFLESSIGKKIMVALTGILLSGFLITHLAGNLFLFAGEGAFNHYAEVLESNPLLPAAEIGLLVLFLVHIVLAARATLANRAARPQGYEVYKGKGARTPGSRSMAITGTLILAFLIVHLKTLRFNEDGETAGMYRLTTGLFLNPIYSGFYIASLLALGVHLSHGFQSAFQTLGLNHPRYTPWIKRLGLIFALLITVGFGSMPLYFGFMRGGVK